MTDERRAPDQGLEGNQPAADPALSAPRGAALLGVIHLPPLPGSPCAQLPMSEIADLAGSQAALLEEAGYDGVIIENYGDVPFARGRVAAVTVAAMTRCAVAAATAAPRLSLGINVLRNDADAALAVAAVSGAAFIRINVHTGARVTDQGIVEGNAHETLRRRRELTVPVSLYCDVDVKHSAPLGPPRPLEDEVKDLTLRGLADAVLVTGAGTGSPTDFSDLARVRGTTDRPVLAASGVTISTLPLLPPGCGVVVGSALRKNGRAGGPIDADCARQFADAFRAAISAGA